MVIVTGNSFKLFPQQSCGYDGSEHLVDELYRVFHAA